MKFDELNQLKQYFGEMELSEEELEKRVSLGKLFYDALSYVLALMWADALLNEELDRDFYINSLMGRLTEAVEVSGLSYEEPSLHRLVESVVDTTIEHYSEEEYFDDERALQIAENGSNSVNNYNEYEEAKRSGKKFKYWRTIVDPNTRFEHLLMDNVQVPFETPFEVGIDFMRYPHDDDPDIHLENIINCRCKCFYF